MRSDGLVYANDREDADKLPRPFSSDVAAYLPTYFAFNSTDNVFKDDHWRSLASFVRKTTNKTCDEACSRVAKGESCSDVCMRGYDRLCRKSDGTGIPFFEFRWAYFMNDAALSDTAFRECYDGVSGVSSIEKIDYHSWQDCADVLIPLCRSDLASRYRLPSDCFGMTRDFGLSLPGFTPEWTPIPDDPSCGTRACSGALPF